MHRREQSEAERTAAEYVARPPPSNDRYPTIDFNNVGGAPFGAPPGRRVGADPQPAEPWLPSAPPVLPSAPPPPPQLSSVPHPVTLPMHQGSPQGPAPSAPASYGQVPQHGQQVVAHPLPTHSAPKHRLSFQQETFQPLPPTVVPQQGKRLTKKAVIIGCNYQATRYELQGCIHDAKNVEFMLQRHFGFRKENIRLLTDDGQGTAMPSRKNIYHFCRWLVADLQPGDSLFFHFSGHGSQRPDYTGDERDGLNETLLPCDFDKPDGGQIVDDDLNEWLINPLPRGVYLHAVIDACHSGTALDLEFYTKLRNGKIEWRSEGPTRKYKGTRGGVAVLFSACLDSQVAQDTDDLSGSVHTGAATHSLIEAIERDGPGLSYSQVLSHMYLRMEELANKPTSSLSSGLGGQFLDKVANRLMSALGIPYQTPQISCNTRLNLNETIHI